MHQHKDIVNTATLNSNLKALGGLKRKRNKAKIDSINLKKASLSLKHRTKPIHEIECKGTNTKNPRKWIEEWYKYGGERCGDCANDIDKQLVDIREVEAEITADEINGIIHDDIHIYDHLQGRATARNNKAADGTFTVPEIIKHLPYRSCARIHIFCNRIFSNTNSTTNPHRHNNNNNNNNNNNSEQPPRWKNTDFAGIP